MSRFTFNDIEAGQFWADIVAERIIAEHPDAPVYTCAAGISPSGIVHFGNFRDIITSYIVAQSLRRKGKNARIIFSWDNFDRLRKVPMGVDPSFAEHIGKPLTKIPDPQGGLSSYAERFQKPFVEAMKELGIELTYIDQSMMYEAGTYDAAIEEALAKREIIAKILLSLMTDKAKEAEGLDEAKYIKEFYPIAIYSRFTGKDNTKVLSVNGMKVTYLCKDTNKEDTVDLTKEHTAKLGWKPDWAMRWRHENVHFEPGGHDHASPGGSFDAASQITRDVFGHTAPMFAEYKFVGIQGLGSKMSGSKGNAVSPKDLLEIYDPTLLKWLYLRKSPQQSFMLAFDSEVYRQYDEFDREVASDALTPVQKIVLDDAFGNLPPSDFKEPISFRNAVGYGQIVQWDKEKLVKLLDAAGLSYNPASVDIRLPRARAWLTKYNPDERIALRSNPNGEYFATLSDAEKEQIRALQSRLSDNATESVAELDQLVYAIPKTDGISEAELKTKQRTFFKHVYNLLIGKDAGPRLSTFLWALDRTTVRSLLSL